MLTSQQHGLSRLPWAPIFLKINKILHITNTMKKRYFDTSLPQVTATPTGAITYITLTDVRLKDEYVVVQFYPWLIHFISLCFWGMVMYDNEFETKKNKI